MFGIIKKMFMVFIVLLSNTVNGCNHTDCVWLSNWKCVIQPALII